MTPSTLIGPFLRLRKAVRAFMTLGPDGAPRYRLTWLSGEPVDDPRPAYSRVTRDAAREAYDCTASAPDEAPRMPITVYSDDPDRFAVRLSKAVKRVTRDA